MERVKKQGSPVESEEELLPRRQYQRKRKQSGHGSHSSGGYNPAGSYCSVKVDETERKSCQQSLMRAEVTDVGQLQEGELRDSRSKQARAEDETSSNSELLVLSG